jgi:hypothetical protein
MRESIDTKRSSGTGGMKTGINIKALEKEASKLKHGGWILTHIIQGIKSGGIIRVHLIKTSGWENTGLILIGRTHMIRILTLLLLEVPKTKTGGGMAIETFLERVRKRVIGIMASLFL